GGAAIVKFLLIGFATGAVTVGSAAAIHHQITKTHVEVDAVVPVKAKTPEVEARIPVAPQPAIPAPEAPKQAPTVQRPSPPRRVEPPPAVGLPSGTQSLEMDSAMSVEVRLLDEARRALGEGRAVDALAALARYAREAPSRRLAPEAAYLEMEANRAR